jgi:hypothetical protein
MPHLKAGKPSRLPGSEYTAGYEATAETMGEEKRGTDVRLVVRRITG